ncbi:hypothetical protein [Thermococcus sp.]|uniref:hypothetical protein n=1 Tax=Thermococcus sp. TaxID=35749 RepID=UPI0025D00325|nr:hypothetical protein [Thermococcus sp.]
MRLNRERITMMEFYLIAMSAGGVLTLLGIFLMWIISRDLEKKFLGSTRVSTLILVGGILTSIGFIVGESGEGGVFDAIMAILVLLGPVIIGYSLMESGVVKPTWELGLQFTLITLSLLMVSRGELNREIITLGSLLSVVLLINGLRYLGVTPGGPKILLRTASWGLVLFSWLRYMKGASMEMLIFDLAVYLLATVLWVSASIFMLVSIRELPIMAEERLNQKGL